MLGLDQFHARHADVGVEIDVTRHPYSFNGDATGPHAWMAGKGTKEGEEPTWHESLLGYCGGSPTQRQHAENSMLMLGRRVGIELDYQVQAQWQPVESQRAMLWAARFGKQELFMDALGNKHFENRKSASHRATIIEAATDVGLDVDALVKFLNTDELEDVVWKSYGSTIKDKGIHAIPFFVFGLEDAKTPFRPDGTSDAVIVRGSGDPDTFCEVFETLFKRSRLSTSSSSSAIPTNRALSSSAAANAE